ncbi:MAG TPA: hypothetical protein PLL69_06570, partial [Gemmatimonadales bacterium]|nr:hypothetical protein [Gemmatimonadales bacterium]
EDERRRVFDMFYSVERGDRGRNGNGLGLPIAGTWLLGTTAPSEWAPVAAAIAVGVILMLAPRSRTRVTGLRYGLVLMGLALLAIGVLQ